MEAFESKEPSKIFYRGEISHVDCLECAFVFAARYIPRHFLCVSKLSTMTTLRTLKYCRELFTKPLKDDNPYRERCLNLRVLCQFSMIQWFYFQICVDD